MLGADRGHMLHEEILKIWCSLARFGVYFDHEKLIYLYVKNRYYSYSLVMRLVIAPGIFGGKHV